VFVRVTAMQHIGRQETDILHISGNGKSIVGFDKGSGEIPSVQTTVGPGARDSPFSRF